MNQTIKNRIIQIKNGYVPDGYKKTEFGIFPVDWATLTIGKFAKVVSGGTPPTSDLECWNGDIYWFTPTEIGKRFVNRSIRTITEKGLKSSNLIPKGNLLLTSRATLGEMSINNFPCSTNQGFQSLVFNDVILRNYVYQLRFVIKQTMLKLAVGSTFLEVSKQKIEKIHLTLPENKAEQERIAEILMTWDEAIELQEQYIEKLKFRKKALLSKMFPTKGKNVPELRFPGFTEPWEQRKVGELLEERDTKSPKSTEYPLMAFIANEGVAPKGERYDRSSLVNDTENKPYKQTEYGDFIYSSNNLETGSIGLNKYGKASISPVYSIFSLTELADSDFLGSRLVRKDFINEMVIWRQGVIYGQWRIHESDFIKIEITVPEVAEQQKIGCLFDKLDNLITLHQCKLEKLTTQRKALMQLLLTGIVRV